MKFKISFPVAVTKYVCFIFLNGDRACHYWRSCVWSIFIPFLRTKKILHHHPLLCLYNFLWCNVSHVYNKTDKRSKLWWKILKCISRSSSKRAGAEIWKRRRSGWRENKTESEISWQKQVAWEREKFLSEKFAIFLLLGMNLRTKYSFALWQTAMAWHWREKAKKTIALMTLMMKNFFFAYEISKNLLALSW